METIVGVWNDFLYERILVVVLIGTGLFFTFQLGFLQVRHFTYLFRVLAGSRAAQGTQISSFQALATSLAARVGTGNLAGVAVALTMGGPGAIFWMWVVAFLGMATTFAECTLAQLYKTSDASGGFRGGPAYYMHRGLGQRWMAVLFSLFLLLPFGLFFNSVQANTIAGAFEESFGIGTHWMGILLALASALVIFGGLRRIARFAELVVPLMALLYLMLASYVFLQHATAIPGIVLLIVKSAFGLEEVVAGGVGFTIGQALTNGVRRGLFSNEAGMGSAPNAAATAHPVPPHPVSQGYVQMLGVFIDTIVICTSTAGMILVSGAYDPGAGVTGITLTQQAVTAHVGTLGGPFVAIAVLLFAFTSIVANYSYAETNLLFLLPGRWSLLSLRLALLVVIYFGAVASLPLVWALADVSMGLMAILNIAAVLALSKTVRRLSLDFSRQRTAGLVPRFQPGEFPGIPGRVDTEVWKR